MDRNPGRLQRAIIELIESSGSEDVGWTTSWLCKHVYGGKSSKSQRSAFDARHQDDEAAPRLEV
jgi:hypothetical protein